MQNVNQVISNTGFGSPCSTKGENYRFSPGGVLDRDSAGETPPACAGRSVMCLRQATGHPNNEKIILMLAIFNLLFSIYLR
jgi:hypothetical protein